MIFIWRLITLKTSAYKYEEAIEAAGSAVVLFWRDFIWRRRSWK